jgi:putative radical SAM enzyme (TIGR03279 family)
VKITSVAPKSIAAEIGLQAGDELLEINQKRVNDSIDLRFAEGDEHLTLKVAGGGEVTLFEISKDAGEALGIELEEMKILSCGNDCIFCFVDQNPRGLRRELYFRDGDYRLSFLYGNYTTMTNAGPAVLQRIVDQRLSPQYISVHVTDPDVRARLMGLRKDDRILEKIRFLRDHGIDMHTQIVLCPGINDGALLEKTIADLYAYRERVISLAIVPVGLTDHRFGLTALRRVGAAEAARILDELAPFQARARREIGRAFLYPSDEFYLLAGRRIPPASAYDGFWQTENGVGLVRSFLLEFRRQARSFPERIRPAKKLTLATGELAQKTIRESLLRRLRAIEGLEVELITVPNTLYGRSVTVAGLLSGKCLYSALKGRSLGDLLLLPPDITNTDGRFLDDTRPGDLARRLGVPVMAFDGDWAGVIHRLSTRRRSA